MSHISSIGAGIFSRLLVNVNPIGTVLSDSDGTFGYTDIGEYTNATPTRGATVTAASHMKNGNVRLGEYFTKFVDPTTSRILSDGDPVKPRSAREPVASAGGDAGRWGVYTYIPNMREAPEFGVPPSLVNVPEFGSLTSKQVQGQADPTNIEVAINYVPAYWTDDKLSGMIDGKSRLMAIVLANAEPAGYALAGRGTNGATVASPAADATPIVGWASSAVANNVQNSIVFFVGEFSALQFQPNLADANQATLTVALKSSFSDAFTFTRSTAADGALA